MAFDPLWVPALALVALAGVIAWRMRGLLHALSEISAELRTLRERLTPEPSEPAKTRPDSPVPSADSEADARPFDEKSERLEQELATLRVHAERQRHLYLLFRGVLADPDVLSALELSAPMPALNQQIAAKPVVAGSDESSRERDAPPLELDAEHQNAARVARVMVADLFLYNADLIEGALDENELRKRLQSQFAAARQTFEARVPHTVWAKKHYLKAEFERQIRRRTGHSETSSPPVSVRRDDASASQVQPVDATKLARLMMAQMMLENIARVEQGIAENKLAAALDPPLQILRKEFDARVTAPRLNGEHPLDLELRRVIDDWEVRIFLDSEIEQSFENI